MPEITPNPCIVCGKEVYPPAEYFKGGYTCICYRDASDHATMVSGRTREECVERWNRLNPVGGHVNFRVFDTRLRARLRYLFEGILPEITPKAGN